MMARIERGDAMARYRVTASSLNVRAGPSITYDVVGWLDQDDLVDWISTSGDGYWLRVKKGKLEGWCAHKYLQPAVAEPAASAPPWMAIATAEIGVKEFPGNQENPRILEYLHSTNLGAPFQSSDETAWCSAFVNWCMERAGYEGTDSAWARSWLNWGKPLSKPRAGCIVVLSRGEASGHVGFYVSQSSNGIKMVGGNQSNQVCVSTYPKSRLLGYRAPGS
jgi:uncharacterized protein (TIGR02594 family)